MFRDLDSVMNKLRSRVIFKKWELYIKNVLKEIIVTTIKQ